VNLFVAARSDVGMIRAGNEDSFFAEANEKRGLFGLGRSLVQHGLMLVRDRPERVINLAVDDANAPALTLYQREGFRPVLRRRAMIRSLRPSQGA
jgi:hypothetical protein